MAKKVILLILGILCCAALLCAGCVSENTPDTQTQDTQTVSEELSIFYEINQVPRPSGNTIAMQNYLTSFAEDHNLQYEKDEVGNVLIKHPGISKYSLILQAHQDMVPAVAEGYNFDFNTDPVQTYIEDGWIHAKNTSLGADDGAGDAIILTALTSPELKDYTFYGLFTVDEETTMLGASSVNPDWLNVDALLNVDWETEGEADLSSAGSITVDVEFTPETETVSENTTWHHLTVSGLLSGHSGLDIDKGRQNAIILAADYLSGLENVQIAEMTGGTAHNAIPAESDATFTTTSDVQAAADAWLPTHLVETDPGLTITVVKADKPEKAYTADFTNKFLKALTTVPNGIMEKDQYGPTVSSNLGTLSNDGDSIKIVCYARCNHDEKLEGTAQKIADVFNQAGAKTDISEPSPAWKVEGETKLMQVTDAAFVKIIGQHAKYTSAHAGLECGYFAEKKPELMLLFIGPTIENPHTIHERMKLDTFAHTKDVVFEVVKNFCGGA